VALEYIRQLVEAARAKGRPVIYTTGERRPGQLGWRQLAMEEHAWRRGQRNVHDDIDGNEIVTMIAPGLRDIVIKKQKPSGFFGTNLASYLTLLGCDSVISWRPPLRAASAPPWSTP
jgi:maleamate amidohydrolase